MERDRLRFRGGRLCLDMTATLVGRYRTDLVDQIADPDGLARWLRATGLLSVQAPVGSALVDQARDLREAVYRLVHPDLRDAAVPEDIVLVNQWAALPDTAPQLTSDARSAYHLSGRRPTDAALSSVARDAVDLLSGDHLDRVRECARVDCSVLFVDSSRPGQRRWCDMAVCGNQTKAQKHRRQQALSG